MEASQSLPVIFNEIMVHVTGDESKRKHTAMELTMALSTVLFTAFEIRQFANTKIPDLTPPPRPKGDAPATPLLRRYHNVSAPVEFGEASHTLRYSTLGVCVNPPKNDCKILLNLIDDALSSPRTRPRGFRSDVEDLREEVALLEKSIDAGLPAQEAAEELQDLADKMHEIGRVHWVTDVGFGTRALRKFTLQAQPGRRFVAGGRTFETSRDTIDDGVRIPGVIRPRDIDPGISEVVAEIEDAIPGFVEEIELTVTRNNRAISVTDLDIVTKKAIIQVTQGQGLGKSMSRAQDAIRGTSLQGRRVIGVLPDTSTSRLLERPLPPGETRFATNDIDELIKYLRGL